MSTFAGWPPRPPALRPWLPPVPRSHRPLAPVPDRLPKLPCRFHSLQSRQLTCHLPKTAPLVRGRKPWHQHSSLQKVTHDASDRRQRGRQPTWVQPKKLLLGSAGATPQRRETRQNRRRCGGPSWPLEFQRQRCSAESWLPRLCRSRRAYRHTGQQVALKGILGPVPEWYLNGFATLEREGSATMKITKSCSGFCARKGCRNLVDPCLLHAFRVL